jgi:hypothetical protein
MQTFLPYPHFRKSLQALDYRRLGKQRLEAYRIIQILTESAESKPGPGYKNHPAVKMWRGHVNALKLYYNFCIDEWVRRGYKNKMEKMKITGRISNPLWLGRKDFHAAHRSNLLRKDQSFYNRYGWMESPDLPYLWK